MKKFLTVVLVIAVIAGIAVAAEWYDTATKEFTCDDLTMEVPIGVKDVTGKADVEGYTFALTDDEVLILGLKEEFDDYSNLEGLTLEEYAQAVVAANGLDVTPVLKDDYGYFRYTADTDEGDYKYFVTVYPAEDGFWMVQFGALITQYEESEYYSAMQSVEID